MELDISTKSNIYDNWSKLSDKEKVRLIAKVYKFKSIPPTLDEFINDDYYLGLTYKNKVYPYWIEKLFELYPNPIISPKRYIIPTGAIGTGKSTFSMIIAMYDLCRLFCLENPYDTIKLIPTTRFTWRCFNLNKSRAYDVLARPMLEAMSKSPFFNEVDKDIENKNRSNIIYSIEPARSEKDIISECLVFALISEINFMKYDTAFNIINSCESRIESRLRTVDGLFGRMIFDSSSTMEESVINEFIKNYPDPNKLFIINTRTWEAKKHLGNYFRLGSFKVYAGSDGVKPHVMEENEDTSVLDGDRIIVAPKELEVNAKMDIELFLNEHCGISVSSQNDFFTNKDQVMACAIEPEVTDPIIVLDFFDDTQLYDIIGKNILKVLPKERKVYGSMDLGLVSDKCGIAISYIDSAKYDNIGGKKIFRPTIKIPVAFALSRKSGQETSIEKIINFWVWLSTVREIGMISTDQFQSSGILQALTKAGIPNRRISTVSSDRVYVEFKNLIIRKKITFPNSKLILGELLNLQRMGNSIDHKANTSKDVSDAMSSSAFLILDAGEDSANLSNQSTIINYDNLMRGLLEQKQKNQILSRFGIRTMRYN